MIIPTPEFDPLFAEDGIPFRTKMIQYIESEFSDILGAQRNLLHSASGLEALSKSIAHTDRAISSQEAA